MEFIYLPMEKPNTPKKFEEIVVSKGFLTQDQVAQVKFESANTGKPLLDIIRSSGIMNSKQIAEVKGELYGYPFVSLKDKTPSQEVSGVISEQIARKYRIFPFEISRNKIQVAMADPLDLEAIQFVEKKSGKQVEPFAVDEEELNKVLSEQFGGEIGEDVNEALAEAGIKTAEIKEEIDQLEEAEERIRVAPVARIVSMILEYAYKSRASDIHVEPQEDFTRVRFRIDGVLQERIKTIPHDAHDSIIARIKILSNLKIDEKRVPQDGRFKIKVGKMETDLRVSTLPTSNGEKVVIRLLRKESTVIQLRDLGLVGPGLKKLEKALLVHDGIILVTGPTGSGKTVTLASALSKINTVRVNIITLEDPVEIRIEGANQVQINPGAGLTFSFGLRSILRQDPNIIMVGEIRDDETASLAIQAALTGHVVLSTLHTNSATGAIPRLLDMKVESFLLASTLELVLAQRLVRKICDNCKEEYPVPKEIEDQIVSTLGDLYKNVEPKRKDGKLMLYRGKGCDKCGKTGYLGRTGIFEVMAASDRINKMIIERRSEDEMTKVAVEEGMITLLQDGFLKVLEGQTTIEDVMRVTQG